LSCNLYNGQCSCRPGVQGVHCDSCMPLHYGFSESGCKACDCDPFGTDMSVNSLQCDDFGKCKCRDHFSGLKCDSCEENRFNFTAGCQKCDECYDLVQNKVTILRQKVKAIEMTLDEMIEMSKSESGKNSDQLNDENMKLQDKLKSLKDEIESLHESLFQSRQFSQTYNKTLIQMKKLVDTLNDDVRNTELSLIKFNIQFEKANQAYSQAAQSVSQTTSQLDFIQQRNKEQVDELESIEMNQNSYDQNTLLQSLARIAREAAGKQRQIAEDAERNYKTTLEEVKQQLALVTQTLHRYEKLNNEPIANNYDQLRQVSSELVAEALKEKLSLDEQLRKLKELYKKLSDFEIPNQADTNVESNDQTADKINEEATLIRKDINELKERIEAFTNRDSVGSIGKAQTQINSAKLKQKDMDSLEKQSERVKNKTDSASLLAEETFINATKILDTLQRFDEYIAGGKDKLTQAESLKPQTDENIENSNRLLQEINRDLQDLRFKVGEIKDISQRSGQLINEANYVIYLFH
jgi:laminin, gamma 1